MHRPRSPAEAVAALRAPGGRGAIARGLGRSHGDAAQNAGGTVLDMTGLDRIRAVDARAGLVDCEAGVSLHRLMEVLLPLGRFVPVVPATRYVTVGGAIAADVHGGNQHAAGSFGRHVASLKLLTPDGEIRTVRPGTPLFDATTGGMGLTGVVLSAVLRLPAVETSLMSVDTERARDLDELSPCSPGATTATSTPPPGSTCWPGAPPPAAPSSRAATPPRTTRCPAATRPAARRSPSGPDGCPPRRRTSPTGCSAAPPPGSSPSSGTGLRPARPPAGSGRCPASSTRSTPSRAGTGCTGPGAPSRTGSSSRTGGRRRSGDRAADRGPALARPARRPQAVRPRRPRAALLPPPGWSLALGLPTGLPGLGAFLDALDEEVAEAGGRVYLAGDSRVRPEVLAAMYPRLDEFRELRAALDPRSVLASDLSRRLGLHTSPRSSP